MIGSHAPGSTCTSSSSGPISTPSCRGWRAPVRQDQPVRGAVEPQGLRLLADNGGVHCCPVTGDAGAGRGPPAGRLRWPGLTHAGASRAAGPRPGRSHASPSDRGGRAQCAQRPALPDPVPRRRPAPAAVRHPGRDDQTFAAFAADLTAHGGDAKAIETVSLDRPKPPRAEPASTIRKCP